jgi:cobyrinic acid a,c-diamide synthase
VQGKHAFVVAGTQSGCGKTSITLALIAAFKARGLSIQPFKVGPDFIDPGFHTQVAGLESRNLDGWMVSRDYCLSLFRRLSSRADMAIVEGVMGLFDGYDGTSEAGSSAQMAKWLGVPVILIVDARSMARSAAALVYGFSRFDPEVKIAGVLFNRIGGPGHLEYLKEAMASSLPDIPVLGGIPRDEGISIPERHLGLVTADEIRLSAEWKNSMVQMVEQHLDLDLILQKTKCEGSADMDSVATPGPEGMPPVAVAVARDAAFCFYYSDNLELLRRAGARIHFFSPLAGETFPEESAGLYIGGGYPEVYARELSMLLNGGFLADVRRAAGSGMPIYAECGGLMTLGRFIETKEGSRYSMAGVLPFGTRMLGRRKALGYTEVVLRQSCLLGAPGMRLRGHEFHYSEIVEGDGGPDSEFAYELQGRKLRAARMEGYSTGSVLASYVHLHWGSAPEAAENFVDRCRKWSLKRKKG